VGGEELLDGVDGVNARGAHGGVAAIVEEQVGGAVAALIPG
jgi:hypothetical protein